jgi:serine O-acetyltransferase
VEKRGFFSSDLDRYFAVILQGRSGFWAKLGIWVTNDGLRCIACYRFGQATARLFRKNKLLGAIPVLLHRIWNRHTVLKYHVDISRKACIGKGIFLSHYIGIIIGPVTIGENCVIHQNVTIGERVASGDHGVPRMGDSVWIGPGSIITGAISIGNNVTISAGCVLSKDVPDSCLVAGNPGRIIMQNYDNSAMINDRKREQPSAS